MMNRMMVEGVPAIIELKMMPVLDPNSRTARAARSLRTRTCVSSSATVATAWANTHRIRDEYLGRSGGRPGLALEELVQLSGGFALDPVVAAELERAGIGRSPERRGRGRPRGMTTESLEVGKAVYYTVQDAVARGSSAERALADLEQRGFERLSFDRLRGLYYRMRRILRPDPLLFTLGR